MLLQEKSSLSFISWNVAGIRASLKKGFWEKMNLLDPDFICLQEIKCQDEQMQELFGSFGSEDLLHDYIPFWHSCRLKKGYSGTAIFIKKTLWQDKRFQFIDCVINLDALEYDQEGRMTIILFEYNNLKLALFNGYYPQGGRGEERIKYKIGFHEVIYKQCQKWQELGYNLILTGDLNTTVGDIDLARPKENRKTTGCLPEERLVLSQLINPQQFDSKQLIITNPDFKYLENLVSNNPSFNLIDTFRYFNPDQNGHYTYWDQITRARDRNVGWRIDYFLIDPTLLLHLKTVTHHDQVVGSDHCPISIELEF
jgi:exodeoxyribonuclease III